MRRLVRVFLMAFALGLFFAAASAETSIRVLNFEIQSPVCGSEADAPSCIIQAVEAATQAEPSAWVTAYDAGHYTPFQGTFTGGETYTAYISFEALPGYRFDADTRVGLYDKASETYVGIEPLLRQPDRIVVAADIVAEHDWDYELGSETYATCVSEGVEHKVCSADHTHTLTQASPIDPDAHQWGDWETIAEATRTQEGERRHVCDLCGATGTEVIGKVKLPYAEVYEPDTSWAMPAIIAWRADSAALSVAAGVKKPATVIVWLDSDLNVYDRDGGLLSKDLGSYIDATAGGTIPAFYIQDARTAASLKAFLPDSGLLDCFVVSTPAHRKLVKSVADLVHVRGMLDCTAIKDPGRDALVEMVASTNDAHGKVILISAEAATRENVRLLQSLASTVWAQTPTDTRTLMTMYTNGVNGVVVDDYQAAIRAEESIRDDAPSLLRVPLIIGHRGDPSSYVENTLDSARGAFEEGVDSVENDIQLSADGELFILHDDTTERLLRLYERDEKGELYRAEHFTLAQLRAKTFDWDSIIAENEVSSAASRCGKLYGQDEQKPYTVPTLREYIDAFKGTGLVHDTEIKSSNPDILPVYKALVDACDAWDQFFTITFNREILNAIYRDYPELSIGALNLGEWMNEDGEHPVGVSPTQIKLCSLFEVLDAWNATYNPVYFVDQEATLRAARHRGLTIWPWTYRIDFDADSFARDYMRAYAGLTCDYPWIASDYIVQIDAQDVVAASLDAIPAPTGKTQAGETRTLTGAEPVLLEALSDHQSLVFWRYRAELDINGTGYGHYYLYSNPFVVSKQAESPLVFTKQPRNAVVQVGEDVSFDVAVDGGVPPCLYQWQMYDPGNERWVDIPSGTGPAITRENIEKKWNGAQFRCVVTDTAKALIASDTATLTVRDAVPTGDGSNLPLYLAVALIALVLMALLRRRAKKA